jgi:radical SAM protein with 4Fe4S-binding SPASM domain
MLCAPLVGRDGLLGVLKIASCHTGSLAGYEAALVEEFLPLAMVAIKNLERAESLGLRNNMWTGGLPFSDDDIVADTARLCRNGLISVHVSTVDRAAYKLLHPDRPESDLDVILDGVRRLLAEGYPPEQILNSATFTGLQTAEDMIRTIDYFEEEFSIRTSLNVYHTYLRPGSNPGELARFIPDEKEVSKVYRRFSRQWGVKEFPMNCVNKQYCSATAAVTCDGSVTPCATIRDDRRNIHRDGSLREIFEKDRDYLISAHFKDEANLPERCRECNLSAECWGCRSRAYAADIGIYGKDPRCFRK